MNVVKIQKHFINVVKGLIENCGFEFFLEDQTRGQFDDWNRLSYEDYDIKWKEPEERGKARREYLSKNGIKVVSGASKVCIVDDNFDYVMKIPFSNFKDHCLAEVEIFESAKKAGIELFFAESAFIGTVEVHGYTFPMYAMEKMEVNLRDRVSSNKIISREVWDKFSRSPICENGDVFETFISRYGEDEVQKLSDFLIDHNLSDFHSSNVGFDKEGNICLIDYSGYSPESYYSSSPYSTESDWSYGSTTDPVDSSPWIYSLSE